MASSSLKTPCVTCANKGAGIYRCEGCLQVFCRKHLNEHRDNLIHQFDEIAIEHDTLKQTIEEKNIKQNQDHTIFKQIDQWEKDSILKIQQIANDAREQVKQFISFETVSQELHNLAEELQQARANDDFVEPDLNQWTARLEKLKQDANTFYPSIFLLEDRKQIPIRGIYISKTAERFEENERFAESVGPIRIDNDNRLARHIGPKNGDAYVRGTLEYSSGKHSVRFFFSKHSIGFITWFEIISKSMPIDELSNTSFAKYGWSSNDDICRFGNGTKRCENFVDMKGQTTFEIEFQLDCDNRTITYVNQRTGVRREMRVDISKCPFPWQVRFYLFEVGDCVQLLS